jgi:PhzF family phenazine biosynthesis protein
MAKMQLNNITKNNQSLCIFNVFSAETIKNVSCKGNPASVFLVDKLPTLKQHLTFLNTLKDVIKKHDIAEFITFVYISNLNDLEYSIRWFSSTSVIKRCGHGTLAAAAFVCRHLNQKASLSESAPLIFNSDIESLKVKINLKENNLGIKTHFYCLQLKQEALTKSNYKLILEDELNICSEAKTQDDDGYIIFELENEAAVTEFKLSKKLINTINKRALIITTIASNQEYDIAFRYFAPFYGELEDNATGSAASIIMPFVKAKFVNEKGFNVQILSEKKPLQLRQLRCYQASKNGGFFTINIKQEHDNVGAKSDTIEIVGQITENIISY